jgi:hypothetical protein
MAGAGAGANIGLILHALSCAVHEEGDADC